MSNTYLDPFDKDSPPHVDGAEDGSIHETIDRDQWTPGQQLLAAWYEKHAVDGLVPPETPIDPLSPVFGLVHKIAVDRERDDFRYLIYGRTIAKQANMGMDGHWVSELVEPTRTVFLEHYRNLVRDPRLFVGRLVYVGLDIPNREWVRAVAPMGTPQQGVTRFIVFTETAESPRKV